MARAAQSRHAEIARPAPSERAAYGGLTARERALRAGLATFEHDRSPVADTIREEFTTRLVPARRGRVDARQSAHAAIHHAALQAARQAVLAMRANDEIGDDAFHLMEEELDQLEMAAGSEPE